MSNAPHLPVHLGAMSEAVKFQIRHYSEGGPGAREGLREGDVLLSNHPQLAGGSHLPDITVITPVFDAGSIVFFVASRGHHAGAGRRGGRAAVLCSLLLPARSADPPACLPPRQTLAASRLAACPPTRTPWWRRARPSCRSSSCGLGAWTKQA